MSMPARHVQHVHHTELTSCHTQDIIMKSPFNHTSRWVHLKYYILLISPSMPCAPEWTGSKCIECAVHLMHIMTVAWGHDFTVSQTATATEAETLQAAMQ